MNVPFFQSFQISPRLLRYIHIYYAFFYVHIIVIISLSTSNLLLSLSLSSFIFILEPKYNAVGLFDSLRSLSVSKNRFSNPVGEAAMTGHELQLRSIAALTLICFLAFWPGMSIGIRFLPASTFLSRFREAPEYRNGGDCPARSDSEKLISGCYPRLVHVAMTLDSEYLRGSVAAVHSVLRHASCPENIFFHFVAAEFDQESPRDLTRLVRSTFPSLNFKVYIFREDTVINLISASIRQALENPLNYARNYLGDILDPCVKRVIYLDSDVVLVDDIHKLWEINLSGSRVIGAPEYCHANFTKYFTDSFWSDPDLSAVFESRRPCYFNTGVMVMDLGRWREGNHRRRIEKWMEIQRVRRIYELGSLPPFLLEFAGDVEAIDHRWNQHGLGGDNVRGSCRSLHPGPVSLLHWSGKGKPWVRLDSKRPCPLDYLWQPYDLYKADDDYRGAGKKRIVETALDM